MKKPQSSEDDPAFQAIPTCRFCGDVLWTSPINFSKLLELSRKELIHTRPVQLADDVIEIYLMCDRCYSDVTRLVRSYSYTPGGN